MNQPYIKGNQAKRQANWGGVYEWFDILAVDCLSRMMIRSSVKIGGYNRVLMFKKFRRAASLILLLISMVLIVWAALPESSISMIKPIITTEMQIPIGTQGSNSTMLEPRRVVLEWPKSMRIGENGEIVLIFEPLKDGTASSILTNDMSDIYNTYNIMSEARFEVAGIRVNPANPTRESMPAGQTVRFKWEINTDHEGSYTGKVWLSLRLLPLDGGEVSQVPIYIQEIIIQTTSLFGLNESMAYLLGGVGVVLAATLDYDDLLALVRKLTRKKISPDKTATKG